MRRWLQGKNKRNLQNKKAQEIAVRHYCLWYSFCPLEVAFLKFAE